MKSWDVAVVGAGVAGSAVAIDLAKRGYQVLLLEKEAQIEHKVCGEFLSGEAAPLLERFGLDLEDCGAVWMDEVKLVQKGKHATTRLPFRARGISRKVLDQALVEKAVEYGVEVRYSSRIESVEKSIVGFRLKTPDDSFEARDVFWATGKSDQKTVHERVGRDEDYVGYKRHLRLNKLNSSLNRSIELHVFEGGYGGLSEVENGLVNFCFVIKKSWVKKFKGRWGDLLTHIQLENPRLKAVFEDAEWQWERPLTVSNIPYGHLYRGSDDFFVLGDQFAVIPSLSGDGMAMALLSAQKAAYHYDRNRRAKRPTVEAIFEFNCEMQKSFAGPVRLGYWLQKLAQYRTLSEWMIGFLRIYPQVLRFFIRQTRCLPLEAIHDAK